MTLIPQEWAYIAGIVDGEGCIEVGHKGKSIRVAITQAYPEVLDYLLDRGVGRMFPGRVQYASGYRIRFRWKVQAQGEVKMFLEGIEPYLILKKRQAKLALKILNRGGGATPEEIEKMKRLKRPKQVSRH